MIDAVRRPPTKMRKHWPVNMHPAGRIRDGLYTAKPGVDRHTIHQKVAAMAVGFFDAHLGTAKR